ncbi:hypothetical protein [Candidatus Coxiella mudrowiae]
MNLKFIIQSDLCFAIKREFHKNNIIIPFPQRDIYIKKWPSKSDKKH